MSKEDPRRGARDAQPEVSGEGLGGRHPYVWYVALTVVLFAFLVIIGYAALDNGWIPAR